MRPAAWGRAVTLGVALAALPVAVLAHPLGNFTINHFAEMRVAADVVSLDVVIDMAEIPTFQERQRIDADGDGTVSDAEASAERVTACARLGPDLHLVIGAAPLHLQVAAAGLSFPAGSGGLATMRLVCEYTAPIVGGLRGAEGLHFDDGSYAERIGWREIVVEGDGVAVKGEHLAGSISRRLTSYPKELLATPRNDRSIDVQLALGGEPLAAAAIPDAQPIDRSAARSSSLAASVPGGEQITALLGSGDLSPVAVLVSMLLAAGLGALRHPGAEVRDDILCGPALDVIAGHRRDLGREPIHHRMQAMPPLGELPKRRLLSSSLHPLSLVTRANPVGCATAVASAPGW